MKWIGQHIWDFVSRFRSDVDLEGISTSTETDMLVVDSDNKVSKRAIDAITVDVSDFMTNGADNRIVTATGTDAMQAETYATFVNTSNLFILDLLSNQDTGDFFRLLTTTNGATVLSTTDDDGSNANFVISIDGHVDIISATNKINNTYNFHATTFENTYSDDDGNVVILKYSPGADDTLAGSELFFLHTDGTWDQTDADAVATGASQLLGIGLGGAARTEGVLLKGFAKIAATEILNVPGSGAVDGLPVYVSTTPGHFDFTAPSGSSDFVRIVGYAIDDHTSSVLIYFDPDKTWIEIA